MTVWRNVDPYAKFIYETNTNSIASVMQHISSKDGKCISNTL